jgi:hypothetical protein
MRLTYLLREPMTENRLPFRLWKYCTRLCPSRAARIRGQRIQNVEAMTTVTTAEDSWTAGVGLYSKMTVVGTVNTHCTTVHKLDITLTTRCEITVLLQIKIAAIQNFQFIRNVLFISLVAHKVMYTCSVHLHHDRPLTRHRASGRPLSCLT